MQEVYAVRSGGGGGSAGRDAYAMRSEYPGEKRFVIRAHPRI